MTALVLIIYVLAAARLTRLINYDAIIDPVRVWLARRFGTASTVLYFIGCPWCVGLWIALAGAGGVVWFLRWPWWVLVPLGLAGSWLVGVVDPLVSDEQVDVETAAV